MSEDKAPHPGCPFRPPAPIPSPRRKFFLSGLWQAQKDLLQILPEITYRTLMGRLPLGLRDIFFASGPAVVREVLSTDAENYPKSR